MNDSLQQVHSWKWSHTTAVFALLKGRRNLAHPVRPTGTVAAAVQNCMKSLRLYLSPALTAKSTDPYRPRCTSRPSVESVNHRLGYGTSPYGHDEFCEGTPSL